MKKLLLLAAVITVGFFWDWIVAGVFGFIAESDPILNGLTLATMGLPVLLVVYVIYRFVKWLRLRSHKGVSRSGVGTNV